MSRRAFTLLETVVAMAILAVTLMAILDINSTAISAHIFARKLTVATLLARSKMTDIEQKLYDEPLPADDDEDAGDFGQEGWPSYKWRAKIIAPRTNGLTPEQLFGALFNLPLGGDDSKDGKGGPLAALFGGGGAPGGLPGGAGGMGGLMGALGGANPLTAQFQQMVDTLQKSVREVHLTVSWKEGKLTESFDLVTHVVSMGPGSDRNGGAAAVAGAPTGAAADQFVDATTGQPVPNAQPGPNGQMVNPATGQPVMTAAQFAQSRGAAGGLNTIGGGGLRPFLPPVGNMVPQGVGNVLRGGGFK
ncbi:MAG: prepilin-type N-terminal cleavage/methylation domain-containing protein [Myxococcaceae bacterium]|nr:prepilin-type N-terminal cleavage/methylation domain-containing protein [Myxococcaceae bacterium]MCA3014711.1 prepilin-type N-terminal cleavage/methylation domain-containing protein [Myxococcaceae bacterium]